MNRTGIEYLTHTWNPIAMRCSPASEGCANCWHLAMAKRHAGNHQLRRELREARGGGAPWLNEGELEAPLRLRTPARIGVQFMGDLFHESIPLEMLSRVMVAASNTRNRHYTFVFLTKRPDRMAAFFDGVASHIPPGIEHPPPNFWLGVTVENQKRANERVPELLRIQAEVRWVSYEPTIGPVEFSPWLLDWACQVCGRQIPVDWPDDCPTCGKGPPWSRGLDWVVAGAETGSRKRPAEIDWFRDVRDQCAAASVPFFFKVDSDGRHELDGITHEELPR